MSRVAAVIPAENDLLCEGCGYTLNGLPEHSNCPECGKPIAQSVGHARRAPAWERGSGQFFRRFISTTFNVLLRPTHFYRTLITRASVRDARHFALLHMLLTATMAGYAVFIHEDWLDSGSYTGFGYFARQALVRSAIPVGFAALFGVTLLAARLTAWEAAYRGLRMPREVVLRGLYYHAAHYVPVAAMALLTVGGYRLLVEHEVLSIATLPTYLYVLSAEVVLGAFYLFHTYWIGMRNIMYANR